MNPAQTLTIRRWTLEFDMEEDAGDKDTHAYELVFGMDGEPLTDLEDSEDSDRCPKSGKKRRRRR